VPQKAIGPRRRNLSRDLPGFRRRAKMRSTNGRFCAAPRKVPPVTDSDERSGDLESSDGESTGDSEWEDDLARHANDYLEALMQSAKRFKGPAFGLRPSSSTKQ